MYYYFLDESGAGFSTKGIAILCCIVIQNYEDTVSEIKKLKDDILHTPRFINLQEIRGEFPITSFHYKSNNFEIRNKFIELLKKLTFQAYICFDPEVTCRDFNTTYDRLFGRLIIDRLRKHRTDEVCICFEQHGSKARRLREIKSIISSRIEEIHREDGRRVIYAPSVRSAGKEEVCLAIADYICAIFRAYFLKNSVPGKDPFETRNFEDVRMKIRSIHDIRNNQFFSRHNPYP